MPRQTRYSERAERRVMAVLVVLIILSIGGYWLAGAMRPKAPLVSTTEYSDSLITSKDYVGPPAHRRATTITKFDQHRVLDLNRVDSLTLIRVPDIGPAFASRILRLRADLGGYYTILQLQEVHGMDEDRYLSIRRWFAIHTPPTTYPLDSLRSESLPRHPYLTREQRRAIARLVNRHGQIRSWRSLMNSGAFSREDSIRLSHYFVELSTRALKDSIQ